jgi:hypothetical protein
MGHGIAGVALATIPERWDFLFLPGAAVPMESFRPLPARKAALVEAPMAISLPVRGLRPVRASRWRVSKLPNPVIWTFSPDVSASEMMPPPAEKRASTAFDASDLLRFVRSASFWASSDLFTAGSCEKVRGTTG